MKRILTFIIFTLSLLFVTCNKYKPAPEAFFIKPSKVSVAPTSLSAQGSGSHKITELFLYVNGKFQGAYESGNTMPVVSRGENVTINVFAGIKNNGLKATTITWLFYQNIKFDTLVETGKTIDRPMTFQYNPNVKFLWIEDFDGNGFSLVKSTHQYQKSDTMFKVTDPGNTFENKSVEIGLTGSAIQALFESSIAYDLPKGNPNVYLELNYKCDHEFIVGITDGLNFKESLRINPNENWNKIYIQLAEAVNNEPVSDKYKVYIRLLKSNDKPSAHVWLDNIKLLYL